MVKMNFEDLGLNKNDRIYLLALLIFASIVSYKLISFQMSGGMYSPDECLYLISAYKYAGLDYNNICNVNDLFFAPVISYCTSLLLRCGVDGHFSISLVTGIFGFLSIFGTYVLLKCRFNSLLSLTGSIIFVSFSVFLLYFASGLIDTPGVCISIWMMVFGICAIDKNPKYFYILFPLTVIGFFTRYTTALTLPVIFLYYLIRRDVISQLSNLIYDRNLFKMNLIKYFKSSEFKIIFISALMSIILSILICKFTLLDYNAPLTFFEQSSNTLNIATASSNTVNYNPSKLFYVKLLFDGILFGEYREFNHFLDGILLFIIFTGLILKIMNIAKNLLFKSYTYENKTKYLDLALVIVMIASAIISLAEFKFALNHLASNIFFLIALLILFTLTSRFNINKDVQSLNLIMFAWFGVYLIFISIYPVKTFRYALPFLPPIVYFIIYGLDSILDTVSFGFSDKDKLNSKISNTNDYIYSNWTKIIPILLILIFAVSTLTHIAPWEIEAHPVDSIKHINDKGYINDLVNITEYIKENDPDYHSKTFASFGHHERMIKYYLNTNLTFVDDNHRLIDESDVDYAILNKHVKLHNYDEIYHCGDFYLYQHN